MFRNRLVHLVVFTIIFISLTLPNLVTQNLIGDEPVYIVEGDRYLHQPYSFYHNSGSPVLLKVITAIPYSFININRTYEPYYNQLFTNVYKVADFVYVQNPSHAQQILILARLPHLVLALLLGYSLYLFTRYVFSPQAGVVVLVLYCFHPTFLAHASTANLDIGVTAFTFWTLILWYLYTQTPRNQVLQLTKKIAVNSPTLLILSGIMLGLAQATKISAILLYPFGILWFLLNRKDKTLKHLLMLLGISFVTLWSLYLFQVGPILTVDDTPAGVESVYGSLPIIKNYKHEITQLLYKPIYPLGAFWNTFAYQLGHSFYGHMNYLNGRFTDQGIWYYIPVIFIIKNSVLFLVGIVAGIALLINTPKKKWGIYYFLWGWILLVLLWSMQSKIQLGIRYVLPIFPFLFMIAAAGITYWSIRIFNRKYVFAAIIVFLSMYTASTLRVGNNYFTYISELYRGHNPVDILFDSDYDWGQDVYRLAEIQKNENLYPLYFRSYGGANLEFEEIKNTMDPAEAFNEKRDGYYAFSHSALVNTRNKAPTLFAYFYSKRPTYIIDKTIYVYKVTFSDH